MGKNIVIIHYNTPRLTECLVMSINKFVKNAKIHIFDNSDKLPFTAKFDNVTIMDNTKGQIINFDKWLEKYPNKIKSPGRVNNWGSAKHAYTIEKCVEMFNEPFVLMDSDILLKRDISELFMDDKVYVGETITQAKSTIKRILPFLCYVNAPMCKKYGIHYFDNLNMHGLYITPVGDRYDTGGAFYLAASKHPHLDISLSEYIIHYAHGSWDKPGGRNQLTPDEWLLVHKRLWSESASKKVIYTCITGGYDNIIEPSKITPGWDYVCFTDNDKMESNVWDIRPLPVETDGLSQVKKQRYVKTSPHLFLKGYDLSIWVDGNVKVAGDLDEFVRENMNGDASVYIPQHPNRKCTYAEARAVVSMRKDTSEIVNPQMDEYKKEGLPTDYGMVQSNIILRKHNNQDCIKLMEYWFGQIREKSHRDQLSFNYSLWKNQDVKIKLLNKTICHSKWFSWLGKHSKHSAKISAGTSFKPKIAVSNNQIPESLSKRREAAMDKIRHIKMMKTRLYW